MQNKGWAAMMPTEVVSPLASGSKEQVDVDEVRMAMARAYVHAFTKGTGPEVLANLRETAYGQPRFEQGHPNFAELSFIRGGAHEVIDFIDAMIRSGQRGEFNVTR